MKMDVFKSKSLIKEFPFLTKLYPNITKDDENIIWSWEQLLKFDTIEIKRADENLIFKVPINHDHDGAAGSSGTDERVHIITNNKVYKSSVKQDVVHQSNYASDGGYEKPGESILNAIARLEVENDVKFIIVENYGWSSWEGSEEWECYTLTIYKAPKGQNIGDYVKKAYRKAEADVKAAANF